MYHRTCTLCGRTSFGTEWNWVPVPPRAEAWARPSLGREVGECPVADPPPPKRCVCGGGGAIAEGETPGGGGGQRPKESVCTPKRASNSIVWYNPPPPPRPDIWGGGGGGAPPDRLRDRSNAPKRTALTKQGPTGVGATPHPPAPHRPPGNGPAQSHGPSGPFNKVLFLPQKNFSDVGAMGGWTGAGQGPKEPPARVGRGWGGCLWWGVNGGPGPRVQRGAA